MQPKLCLYPPSPKWLSPNRLLPIMEKCKEITCSRSGRCKKWWVIKEDNVMFSLPMVKSVAITQHGSIVLCWVRTSRVLISTHYCPFQLGMSWDRPWWHLSLVWARHILCGPSVPVGKTLLCSSEYFESEWIKTLPIVFLMKNPLHILTLFT